MGAGTPRYSGRMRLRDILRRLDALEGDQARHLSYVQGLAGKDLRKLWRMLPKGQKRLLRPYHRALLARSVALLG